MTSLVFRFFQLLTENQHIDRPIDPLETAVRMLDMNYNAFIKMTDISKKLFMNPIYFSRFFKEHMGISPKQYLLKKRIERAEQLIEKTDYSVQEIALSVGYKDALYFSRFFKKETGFSPVKYRNRRKTESKKHKSEEERNC